MGCDYLCATAVRCHSYDLVCLKYAHEQRCPWDHETYQAALEYKASTKHNSYMKASADSILAYLETHGCPKTAQESVALHAQMACNNAKVDHEESLVGNDVVAAVQTSVIQQEETTGDRAFTRKRKCIAQTTAALSNDEV